MTAQVISLPCGWNYRHILFVLVFCLMSSFSIWVVQNGEGKVLQVDGAGQVAKTCAQGSASSPAWQIVVKIQM